MSALRWGLAAIYVGATLGLLAWAYDVPQRNEPRNFLSVDSYREFQDFSRRVPADSLLLFCRWFDGAVSTDREASFEAACRDIARRRGADVVTARELSPRAESEALLPLRGPHHLAGIMVLPEDLDQLERHAVVEDLLESDALGGDRLALSGTDYTNFLLDRYSTQISTQLLPLVFVLCFVLLWLRRRSLWSALTIYIPSIAGLALTLALIKVSYGNTDMITAIVPLLIFVLDLGIALHLHHSLLETGSLRAALSEKLRPILLMVLTTSVGFGALALSEIPAIRRFGTLCFASVGVSSLITVGWYSVARPTRLGPSRPVGWATRWLAKPRAVRWTLCTITLTTLAGVLCVPTIPINTDAITYFPHASGIESRVRRLEREVVGLPILDICVDGTRGGTAAQQRRREAAERAVAEAAGPGVRLLSASVILRAANLALTGRDEIPASATRTAVAALVPRVLQRAYLSAPTQRITLLGPHGNFSEHEHMVLAVEERLRAIPGIQWRFGGLYHTILQSQDALIRTLAFSLTVSALVIAAIFATCFRSARLTGIFLLVNACPLLGCAAFISLIGFDLNVATVMVFSVALGVVVDSTLHVVHGFPSRASDPERYLRTVVRPVVETSVVLVPAFLLFGIYGFLPIRQFGVTLGTALLLALFFDLCVLPSLLHASGRSPRPSPKPSEALALGAKLR